MKEGPGDVGGPESCLLGELGEWRGVITIKIEPLVKTS